jgi:hypothetical protein
MSVVLLSTPCNGFAILLTTLSPSSMISSFQLHVMDSLLAMGKGSPYDFYLSTPCNGFVLLASLILMILP